jgi:regulator of sirC expression with transglutaminase-like and TPR domain
LGQHYAFDPNDPSFVEAEKLLEKAIATGRKVISKDPEFKSRLSKMHRMLRDIYDLQLQGNKAVEQCLEMYKLNPEDNEVISWLKQAEKNTGKKFI